MHANLENCKCTQQPQILRLEKVSFELLLLPHEEVNRLCVAVFSKGNCVSILVLSLALLFVTHMLQM